MFLGNASFSLQIDNSPLCDSLTFVNISNNLCTRPPPDKHFSYSAAIHTGRCGTRSKFPDELGCAEERKSPSRNRRRDKAGYSEKNTKTVCREC
jgi:hypothetical protein